VECVGGSGSGCFGLVVTMNGEHRSMSGSHLSRVMMWSLLAFDRDGLTKWTTI
jgi:hypothetical protein